MPFAHIINTNFSICMQQITNLTESKSRRWTPLVTSAVLKPNWLSRTIKNESNKLYPLAQLLEHFSAE